MHTGPEHDVMACLPMWASVRSWAVAIPRVLVVSAFPWTIGLCVVHPANHQDLRLEAMASCGVPLLLAAILLAGLLWPQPTLAQVLANARALSVHSSVRRLGMGCAILGVAGLALWHFSRLLRWGPLANVGSLEFGWFACPVGTVSYAAAAVWHGLAAFSPPPVELTGAATMSAPRGLLAAALVGTGRAVASTFPFMIWAYAAGGCILVASLPLARPSALLIAYGVSMAALVAGSLWQVGRAYALTREAPPGLAQQPILPHPLQEARARVLPKLHRGQERRSAPRGLWGMHPEVLQRHVERLLKHGDIVESDGRLYPTDQGQQVLQKRRTTGRATPSLKPESQSSALPAAEAEVTLEDASADPFRLTAIQWSALPSSSRGQLLVAASRSGFQQLAGLSPDHAAPSATYVVLCGRMDDGSVRIARSGESQPTWEEAQDIEREHGYRAWILDRSPLDIAEEAPVPGNRGVSGNPRRERGLPWGSGVRDSEGQAVPHDRYPCVRVRIEYTPGPSQPLQRRWPTSTRAFCSPCTPTRDSTLHWATSSTGQ
jgi:hypothetical protein